MPASTERRCAVCRPRRGGRVSRLARSANLVVEGLCFPTDIDSLKPVLELAHGAWPPPPQHQPNLRPRTLSEAAKVAEGWVRLGEQAPFPDLCRDASRPHDQRPAFHARPDRGGAGAEAARRPVALCSRPRNRAAGVDEVEAQMATILSRVWAYHGRVASSEQVQVPLGFPQHRPWRRPVRPLVARRLRRLAGPRRRGCRTHLRVRTGPQPYAISGCGRRRPHRSLGGIAADARHGAQGLARRLNPQSPWLGIIFSYHPNINHSFLSSWWISPIILRTYRMHTCIQHFSLSFSSYSPHKPLQEPALPPGR